MAVSKSEIEELEYQFRRDLENQGDMPGTPRERRHQLASIGLLLVDIARSLNAK